MVSGLGFGFWGLGFGDWGLGFGGWGLGIRTWGLGFGISVGLCTVLGFRFDVQVTRCRVLVTGLTVQRRKPPVQ